VKDIEKLLREITETATAPMPPGTVYDDGFDDFLININTSANSKTKVDEQENTANVSKNNCASTK
jgi:hypothetical protein